MLYDPATEGEGPSPDDHVPWSLPAGVVTGDALAVLARLPANSIDAVVTDPPYGIAFMQKSWDTHSPAEYQAWCEGWAAEALRVVKPGGYLVAFSGTRTYHRLVVGVEDAGWVIRDSLQWCYGSGFPKGVDVARAINKAEGVEYQAAPAEGVGFMTPTGEGGYNVTQHRLNQVGEDSPEAAAWAGWNTALKPAHEPIVLARKPLEGTVIENVRRWGTGALNIGGCRIGGETLPAQRRGVSRVGTFEGAEGNETPEREGRWPANVLLDPEAARLLDEQSGEIETRRIETPSAAPGGRTWGSFQTDRGARGYTDTGGASRFFYQAKASRAERNAGLSGERRHVFGDEGETYEGLSNTKAAQRNYHPTVKPIDVMRWLVRLVTPPGGHVLDPFTGSGTTGIAAGLEGMTFTGIERETEYAAIAAERMAWWADRQGDTADILAAAGLVEKAEADAAERADLGQLDLLAPITTEEGES